MKARTVIPMAVVAILLLGGVALDVPGTAPAVAQTCEPGSAARYIVEQGAAPGGRYRLTSLTWQVCGTASGGAYRLLGPEAPALLGSGCCCTYLPLVLR